MVLGDGHMSCAVTAGLCLTCVSIEVSGVCGCQGDNPYLSPADWLVFVLMGLLDK